MEAKASLKQVTRDWISKRFQLTFEVEGDVTNALDDITDKPLRLKAVKWREKRSLDSNAYMWLLEDKIAKVIDSTREEVHRLNVLEYGPIDEIDGSPIVITLKSKVDISHIDGYWKLFKVSEDGTFKGYYRIKPTHEYDTKEMSEYLDRVIEAAKELGIETATPEELARMEQLYEQNKKRAG